MKTVIMGAIFLTSGLISQQALALGGNGLISAGPALNKNSGLSQSQTLKINPSAVNNRLDTSATGQGSLNVNGKSGLDNSGIIRIQSPASSQKSGNGVPFNGPERSDADHDDAGAGMKAIAATSDKGYTYEELSSAMTECLYTNQDSLLKKITSQIYNNKFSIESGYNRRVLKSIFLQKLNGPNGSNFLRPGLSCSMRNLKIHDYYYRTKLELDCESHIFEDSIFRPIYLFLTDREIGENTVPSIQIILNDLVMFKYSNVVSEKQITKWGEVIIKEKYFNVSIYSRSVQDNLYPVMNASGYPVDGFMYSLEETKSCLANKLGLPASE